jgi:hypothetical protein
MSPEGVLTGVKAERDAYRTRYFFHVVKFLRSSGK